MIFPYCHHKREVNFSTTDKQNLDVGNMELCFQTDLPVCMEYKEYFEFSDSYFYTNICKNIHQEETVEQLMLARATMPASVP